MSNEVDIDEQCVRTLERYSLKGVAEIPLMIDRIVREWYSQATLAWLKRPALIPALPKVPEGRIVKVKISRDHAKEYKATIAGLNAKLGTHIQEADLTTYLASMFIMAFKIKQKADNKDIPKY